MPAGLGPVIEAVSLWESERGLPCASALQHGNIFDVLGVRKHIHRLEEGDTVAALLQQGQVAGLGFRAAAPAGW